MSPEQGKAFLEALGAKKIQKNGKWLQATCPLAPALHKGHKDTNPSFGMTVEPDKKSRWNCFACGHGSCIDLIQQLEFHQISANTPLAREILLNENLEVVPLPEYGEFFESDEHWVFRPWPELWLSQFPQLFQAPLGMQYVQGRGVTPLQVGQFDLRWDIVRQMVVFPIREANGLLAGARGRAVDPLAEGGAKHYDYSHEGIPKNIKGVWFNEPALHLPGPVVVVEGQFDVMTAVKVWPKTVGNLTAKPTRDKLMKLALTPGVIFIPDNDETGAQSIAKYQEGLLEFGTRMTVCELPPSVKDVNECHPGFLSDLLQQHVQDLW